MKLNTSNSVILFFILCTVVLYQIFNSFLNLSDTDGYYHLAIARHFYQQGFTDKLDWGRFSIMHQHFGDVEFLFHILLIPFIGFLSPKIGIPLFSSLLSGTVLTAIYYVCLKNIGSRSWIIPLWLVMTAVGFAVRLTEMKAELLGIVILIFLTLAVAKKRYLKAFVLSFLYCLSYSAYHIPFGLALLWFLVLGVFYKEWDFKFILFILLGSVLGIVVHPGFPSNLIEWCFQYVKFVQFHTSLTMPPELFPLTFSDFFVQNLGWLLGLCIIWRSTERKQDENIGIPKEQIFFTINALVFIVLFIFMRRFVIYVVPFVTIVVVFAMQRKGLILSSFTRLPGGQKVPLWVSFGFCFLIGIFQCQETYKTLGKYGVFVGGYQENWDHFSRQLKDHAKVAASVLDSHAYVWAAPQADYLCQKDPVFMAKLYPELFKKQFDIWTGSEPDVPLVTKAYLDSDYVAFANDIGKIDLYDRLSNDPRSILKHENKDVLFEIQANNKDFVLDWNVVSGYLKIPLEKEKVLLYGQKYPRALREIERNTEGYIDGLRTNPNDSAVSFVHFENIEEPMMVTYELACYGTCNFWHNDKQILSVNMPTKAILGKGVVFTLLLDQGSNTFTVKTYSYQKRLGFYLLERKRESVLRSF